MTGLGERTLTATGRAAAASTVANRSSTAGPTATIVSRDGGEVGTARATPSKKLRKASSSRSVDRRSFREVNPTARAASTSRPAPLTTGSGRAGLTSPHEAEPPEADHAPRPATVPRHFHVTGVFPQAVCATRRRSGQIATVSGDRATGAGALDANRVGAAARLRALSTSAGQGWSAN